MSHSNVSGPHPQSHEPPPHLMVAPQQMQRFVHPHPHHLPNPSPPIQHIQHILQRPPHPPAGNHMNDSSNTSPIPTRPSSTPSPASLVQQPSASLVSEHVESLSNHIHSQPPPPHMNTIPTVSALSTGPEVDFADLNQKPPPLSSLNNPNHVSNTIMKNKHKAVPLPTTSPLPSEESCNTISTSTPPVNTISTTNAPIVDSSPSFPPDSSSEPPTFPPPNQSRFFNNAVESATYNEIQQPIIPPNRDENGDSYAHQRNQVRLQAPPPIRHTQPPPSSEPVTNQRQQTVQEVSSEPFSRSNETSPVESQAPLDPEPEPSPVPVPVPAPASHSSPEPVTPEPNPEPVKESTPVPAPIAQQTAPPPPRLKHVYQQDQWSPINQDGVKKYSRDFLLELQDESMSKPKPANLPDLEIVLKDTHKQAYGAKNSNHSSVLNNNRHDTMFTPHYCKPGNVRQNSRQHQQQQQQLQQQQQPILKTRSIQGGKLPKPVPPKPANIVLSISLKDDIKLRESENAWRPNNIVDEDEKFYKQVRGVLNKLTPENFESLKTKFKEFPINTTARLERVIDIVFQKAIAEPSFSEFYAKMCWEMREMKREVVDDTKPKNKDGKYPSVNFNNLLLNKCQQEFEKNECEERKNDINIKQIEAEPDPEKRKELRLIAEEEERLIRKRSVGNCRFIGELYKLNMLTTKIMHHCISDLLKKTEEEPLERACKLLSTIGKDLESHEKDASVVKNYFLRMEDLASKRNNNNISSRVRFMLLDVIDLRKNKWVPRRNENRPKTIQQIQYEADTEKMGISLNKKPMSIMQDKALDNKSSLDNRKTMGQKDWSTPNNSFKGNYSFDKSKLLPIRDSPNDVELGPSNKDSWNKGSNINNKHPHSSQQWQNKGPSDANSFHSSIDIRPTNNKLSSSYRPSYNHKPVSMVTPTITTILQNNNNMLGNHSKTVIEPTSLRSQLRQAPNDTERDKVDKLMCDQRKRCKTCFDEYFCNNDFNELIGEKEKQEITNVDFIFFAFEIGTQRSDPEYHRGMSKLIILLEKRGVVSKQVVCEAMREFFLNTIENDLYTDTPYLSKYIAEMIAPLIEYEVVLFENLKSATTCLNTEHSDCRFPLVKELLVIIGYDKAPTWLQKKWNAGRLKLSDYTANSEKMVKVYPFFFLTNMEQADLNTVIKVNRNDDLKSRIKDIIISHERIPCASVSLCEDLVNWTRGNFGSISDLGSSYYRALTSAICEISIIKNSGKLNVDEFSKYIYVYKLLELSEAQEVEVLESVFLLVQHLEFPQDVVVSFPGLLLDCFRCLFQESSISIAAFRRWSKSDEKDGKGVALKQLHSFFQSLTDYEP
uniref:Eukaryotic translation initiation factor 4 gamma 3 n=1 Tax=Cacopsylla melanoneura TaxID=428564 RepID=A0A8D9EQJ7_9HEMI